MNFQRRTKNEERGTSVVRPPHLLSDLGCRLSSVVCHPSSAVRPPPAFTLIELLVAVALLGMALAMTFTTFYSVSKAWQRGTTMANDLDHGEYVMQQLVCGLRSAFFTSAKASSSSNSPSTNASNSNATGSASAKGGYGFVLEDNGSGDDSHDTISWVKTGTSLLGANDPLYKGLHRVQISIEDDEDGAKAVAVRAWRPYANSLNFDSESIPPRFISGKVVGMNCRVAMETKDEKWDWKDTWEAEATNCLPLAVEITLYLEPLEPGEPPVEIQRTVEIPVAPLSWVGVQKSTL